ncbi:hypothetical protein ACA910_016797 [Epithemia clementina (nom. ined.)]
MESLQEYGSSSEGEGEEASLENEQQTKLQTTGEWTATNKDEESSHLVPVVQRVDRSRLNAAPAISLKTKALTQLEQQRQQDQGTNNLKRKHGNSEMLILRNNPTKDVLYEPVQGPANDASTDTQRQLSRYQPREMQANMAIEETAFHQQRLDFQRTGRAMPLVHCDRQTQPAQQSELVRTTLGYDQQRLAKFKQEEVTRKKMKQALVEKGTEKDPLVLGSDDELEFGVWGPPSRQEAWHAQNKLTNAETGDLAPEQEAEREYIRERNRVRGLEEEKQPVMTLDRVLERKMAHLLPPPQPNGEDSKPFEASSTFHGDAEYDYKGRSWIAPPPGLTAAANNNTDDNVKSHVPKKCVARFAEKNQQGVHRIRLFPGTGHLLLSAGLDGSCKVWSVEQRKVMRTYKGHSAGVRDMQFNLSGSQFVSASFDRFLRLWDTESGDVVQTFSNGKVPYCVQFYPRDDSYFVVGCSDNRIVTYHTKTGELTQEYNHHLAPVNAILFVESEKNEPVVMVSSSDDKKILVWEWDIGVPIKYISDPTMHSMPCMAMHPTGQYFCGQSLDNTICCVQTTPKIKILHNKKFSGHIVSGYACELTFSPDGRFVVSGDGTGALFIWDWKRHKILQKFRAHEPGKPTIGVVWHPIEPSTLFTCSWDGYIKVWQ